MVPSVWRATCRLVPILGNYASADNHTQRAAMPFRRAGFSNIPAPSACPILPSQCPSAIRFRLPSMFPAWSLKPRANPAGKPFCNNKTAEIDLRFLHSIFSLQFRWRFVSTRPLKIFVALQIDQPLPLLCLIPSSTRLAPTYCVPDQDLLRIRLLLQSILNLENSSNPFFYLRSACYTLLSSLSDLLLNPSSWMICQSNPFNIKCPAISRRAFQRYFIFLICFKHYRFRSGIWLDTVQIHLIFLQALIADNVIIVNA